LGPDFSMQFSALTSFFASLTALTVEQPPTYRASAAVTYPHDARAFTQGLCYEPDKGTLLESTGLYGESTARRVQVQSGRVLQEEALPGHWFGEGLAVRGGDCVQLLWRENMLIVRDAQTLEMRGLRPLPRPMREGWGLTHDGAGTLYASDGSDQLFAISQDLKVEHTRRVTAGGRPLSKLNDLQWVNGEVWANLWYEERLAVINPQSGVVRCFVDLSGLLSERERQVLLASSPASDDFVLNGLAYDAEGRRLFVTGKCWPKLFEIRVDEIQ